MTRRLERLEFRAVGTTCGAAVTTGGPGDLRRAARALSAAKAEVDACERALSRFDPTSDLSRLNAAGGEWTAVDERLVESLRLAIRMREDTGGRFDPTVLPALVAAGYDRTFEQLTPRLARRADGWRAGAAIEVDEHAGRVRTDAGAAVDLGGIGKGYAATRALEAMTDSWPRASRWARRPRRRSRNRRRDAGAGPVADRDRGRSHAGRNPRHAPPARRRRRHLWARSPPLRPRRRAPSPHRPGDGRAGRARPAHGHGGRPNRGGGGGARDRARYLQPRGGGGPHRRPPAGGCALRAGRRRA